MSSLRSNYKAEMATHNHMLIWMNNLSMSNREEWQTVDVALLQGVHLINAPAPPFTGPTKPKCNRACRYHNMIDGTPVDPPLTGTITCFRKQQMLYNRIPLYVHAAWTSSVSVSIKYINAFMKYYIGMTPHLFLYHTVLVAACRVKHSIMTCL